MKKIYKSFNQFNECKKALRIDYTNKSFKIYHGEEAPLGYDVKTTTKKIDEKIKELKLLGLTQEN